jgi:hypothetical protein
VSEGLYVSEKARTRRRRRIAGIAAAVAVALAAGSYATATWLHGRDQTGTGDVGALAPAVSGEPSAEPYGEPPPEASATPSTMPTAPTVGPAPGTRAAQRRSSTPSPVPSPPPMSDEDIAAAQVSRLLQPLPSRTGGVGVAAAGETVTVRNEVTPDGANVRVVSARADLTGQLKRLWAGDLGHLVDGARCTHNIRTDKQPVGQMRPGMLLCWRSTPGRSVVAVATGRPQEMYTAAVVAREWATLG